LFGEFFDWWGGQLREVVPVAWRSPAGGADCLIADASEPGLLTLLRRRRGVTTRVAQLPRDDSAFPSLRAALANRPRGEPVFLRIPVFYVLERAVSLPLAAERDLARVLGYEMERLTPFTAAELVWDYAIEQRDRTHARLQLRLTVVQRTAVETLIAQLRDQGVAPEALEAILPDGPRVLKLAQERTSTQHFVSARSLLAATAALAFFVIASPFLRQSLDLADLQDRLGMMAPRIAQVQALRGRIAGSTAGGDAVATETRKLGDTLEALAALTEILPDDSYLTEFTMRERKMTLAGLGASAPKLISALSADPRIRGPAFTAPVTRSETNHNDVFAIRAELAP
jgi:general secretion pathway protein L